MRILSSLHSLFQSDTTRNKVVKNVLWAVIGKVVTLLSTLFVGILVARYLGPEQYGLMNYVVSIVTLFSVFSTFGMTEIIIRELSRKDLPKEVILGTSFRLRIVLAMVALIILTIYLVLSNETAETVVMVIIYSSSLIFSCFDVIRHYFTSIVQNEYVVKSEIFRTLVGAIIKIVLLLVKAPLWAFVTALAIDFILLAGGYITAYRNEVGNILSWKFDSSFGKKLLSTSLPLVISGAAVIVYQRIDQVMIGKMLDNEQLGYFSTASSFLGVITFIPSIMIQTLAPILVRHRKENEEVYKVQAQKMMNITVWITIFVSCAISMLSYHIIKYTYGSAFLSAVPAMQILAFKAVGVALISVGGQLIIIENIHQLAFLRNIMSCVVCVIFNYLFIPQWGIIGSAWATIITVMFTGALSNIFIPRYYHIFRMQCRAILVGWKDLYDLKALIKK